jgi:hypothetical protein
MPIGYTNGDRVGGSSRRLVGHARTDDAHLSITSMRKRSVRHSSGSRAHRCLVRGETTPRLWAAKSGSLPSALAHGMDPVPMLKNTIARDHTSDGRKSRNLLFAICERDKSVSQPCFPCGNNDNIRLSNVAFVYAADWKRDACHAMATAVMSEAQLGHNACLQSRFARQRLPLLG